MMMVNHSRLAVLSSLVLMTFAAHKAHSQSDVIRNLQVKASNPELAIGFTSYRNENRIRIRPGKRRN